MLMLRHPWRSLDIRGTAGVISRFPVLIITNRLTRSQSVPVELSPGRGSRRAYVLTMEIIYDLGHIT